MCAVEAENSGNGRVTKISWRSVLVMKIGRIYGKVIQSNNLKLVRSISFQCRVIKSTDIVKLNEKQKQAIDCC